MCYLLSITMKMSNTLIPWAVRICLLPFALAALPPDAAAQERIAVVVGNAAYTAAPRLDNALRDANAVAAALKKAGFRVYLTQDGSTESIYSGVQAFRNEGRPPEVGLFYFAGHGIEVAGRNYLLPVDAVLEKESQLRTQAVSVDSVLGDMKEAGVKAKLVILDCCRDNPLTRSWAATRSMVKGLAEIREESLPEATMIMFAAGPGQPALDGSGPNSPFTTALLEHLTAPGVSAFDAFLAVSDSVDQVTFKKQTPWLKFDGAGQTFRQFTISSGAVAMTARPAVTSPTPVVGASSGGSASPMPTLVNPPSPAPVAPRRGYFTLDEIFQDTDYASFKTYSRMKILQQVQAKLSSLGYYQGTPDGQPGSMTHAAIVRWQNSSAQPPTGLLSSTALKQLGLDDMQEQKAPVIAGRWRGTYHYGAGYFAGQRLQPVRFDLVIADDNGDTRFTGVYTEPYTGFGSAGPDGQMHGSVSGSVIEERGRVRIQFEKSYRYFDQPPAQYEGTLNPATGKASGEWGFGAGGGQGTFTLERQP